MKNATAHLPLIDLAEDPSQSSRQLLEAASEWGFVYIKSTGLCISPQDVDRAFELVFHLSESQNSQGDLSLTLVSLVSHILPIPS